MSINSFLLFSASFLNAAAFQIAPLFTSNKYHNNAVVRKYARDHAEESNAHNVLPSNSAETSIIEMTAENVVTACMDAMLQNDVPWLNAGLETCFDFSSDKCRAALGGSLDEFISYASNPTFGSMTNAKEYKVVNVGPIIAGTATRGSMQTVLVKVTPAKGGDRQFLWTLQQERRPPRQGLWLVHECIYVEMLLGADNMI